MFLTTRNSRRDPATAELVNVGNGISRLLNDAFSGLDWQYRDSVGASWVPAVDIFEEADAIRIMAEVPGVKPEDVKISLEGNVLTIHGQKQQSAEERTERCYKKQCRDFHATPEKAPGIKNHHNSDARNDQPQVSNWIRGINPPLRINKREIRWPKYFTEVKPNRATRN